MPAPLYVLSIPGLSRSAVDGAAALRRLGQAGTIGSQAAPFPSLPGPIRAGLMTGATAAEHGVIGDRRLDRATGRVVLAAESAGEVTAERLWTRVRRERPELKAALLFADHALDGDADFVLQPTTEPGPDGGAAGGMYDRPAGLYAATVERLGREFPYVNYSGPLANLESARWIIEATAAVAEDRRPDLCWVGLPHLLFGLQRWGPGSAQAAADLAGLDELLAPLLERLASAGATVLAAGEFVVRSVSGAVFPNRLLRQAGLLRVRVDKTREYLDVAGSQALAVVDRQTAHIYCRTSDDVEKARTAVAGAEGVGQVLSRDEFVSRIGGARPGATGGAAVARCGDVILFAPPDRWFGYYWWMEDGKAPPFARAVAPQAKPGVDPMELFINPRTKAIDFSVRRIKGSFGAAGTPGPGSTEADAPAWLCSRRADGAATIERLLTED